MTSTNACESLESIWKAIGGFPLPTMPQGCKDALDLEREKGWSPQTEDCDSVDSYDIEVTPTPFAAKGCRDFYLGSEEACMMRLGEMVGRPLWKDNDFRKPIHAINTYMIHWTNSPRKSAKVASVQVMKNRQSLSYSIKIEPHGHLFKIVWGCKYALGVARHPPGFDMDEVCVWLPMSDGRIWSWVRER